MKRSIALAAAVVVVLLLCSALAPAKGAAQSWAALSKRMIDDCAKFSRDIKDMTLALDMSVPSSDGAVTSKSILYRKGKRFRAEISMDGMEGAGVPAEMANMKTIVISDGTNVWIIAPMLGKSQVPPDEGKKYSGQWTCSDYIPADAQVIGSETIDGRACYVLSVLDASSDVAKLWIDQKDLSLLKMVGKEKEGEAMTALFSDFRRVADDLELAYKTEMYSGGDLITTMTITSVEINKGLADDLFDPDKVKVEGADMLNTMKQAMDTIKTKQVD
jgi:outer membrane lipoprotein-sorting protein